MSNKKKEPNQKIADSKIEDLFSSLKSHVELLEDQEVDIEKSFSAYEDSMKIIKEIHKKIFFYKGKLEILNKKNKFNSFNSDSRE